MEEFNPDAFLAQAEPAPMPQASVPSVDVEGFDPDAFIEDSLQSQYGGLGQQITAGVEGVAQGFAGPLATLIEKNTLGIPEEDIRGREEANPITHGVGEAAGLGAGLFTGTGEAALMTKAGQIAMKGLELEKVATVGARIGSAAVQQAAEMAVYTAGTEASKLILNDPNTSAESAIANIGLGAALGAAGGIFFEGAVSPLWKATAGPKLEKFLGGVTDHMNGGGRLILPEEAEQAIKTLGVDVEPAVRAGISGDPRASRYFNDLREMQKPEILNGITNLKNNVQESVLKSTGKTADDIAVYSEANQGHSAIDAFKKEYQTKFEPIQKQYDQLKLANETLQLTDDARLQQYGKMVEEGMNFGAAGAPEQELFHKYGNRLVAQDTLGQVDKVVSEINNEMKMAYRSGDNNKAMALKQIKGSIQDFQENQISKAFSNLEKEGVDGAKSMSKEFMAERAAARADYARVARISDEISQQLGLGEFRGAKGLLSKLSEKRTPEEFLSKLSPQKNADLLKFMEEHFPDTLNKVRENELIKVLKPALQRAGPNDLINIKTLNSAIEKMTPEMRKFAVPEEIISKVKAADKILSSLPAYKSSGTAGWQQHMMKKVPQNALAAVGAILGHNPISGWFAGKASQYLSREAPDAIKLGLLKYLGSDQPVKAEGFKAMVQFFDGVIKGQSILNKASGAVFKTGQYVIAEHLIPDAKDREKLDKTVEDLQNNPDDAYKMAGGPTGYYLPGHEGALTQASMNAVKYLQDIKPKSYQAGPLDKPIEPSKAELSRYNRALDIATEPNIVLQHVKDGTLQTTDLQDLKSMFPGLYQQMAQKLTNNMINAQSEEEPIPYKTRMSLSLFLGQPIDSSMTLMSIQAAQPKPQAPNPPPASKTDKLGKSNKSYMTSSQRSEFDRNK